MAKFRISCERAGCDSEIEIDRHEYLRVTKQGFVQCLDHEIPKDYILDEYPTYRVVSESYRD